MMFAFVTGNHRRYAAPHEAREFPPLRDKVLQAACQEHGCVTSCASAGAEMILERLRDYPLSGIQGTFHRQSQSIDPPPAQRRAEACPIRETPQARVITGAMRGMASGCTRIRRRLPNIPQSRHDNCTSQDIGASVAVSVAEMIWWTAAFVATSQQS
jgi:hypothetical protein